MNLELNDLQTENADPGAVPDRAERSLPLSVRIVTLKEILAKLRAEPERPLMPQLQHFAPPSKGKVKSA